MWEQRGQRVSGHAACREQTGVEICTRLRRASQITHYMTHSWQTTWGICFAFILDWRRRKDRWHTVKDKSERWDDNPLEFNSITETRLKKTTIVTLHVGRWKEKEGKTNSCRPSSCYSSSSWYYSLCRQEHRPWFSNPHIFFSIAYQLRSQGSCPVSFFHWRVHVRTYLPLVTLRVTSVMTSWPRLREKRFSNRVPLQRRESTDTRWICWDGKK